MPLLLFFLLLLPLLLFILLYHTLSTSLLFSTPRTSLPFSVSCSSYSSSFLSFPDFSFPFCLRFLLLLALLLIPATSFSPSVSESFNTPPAIFSFLYTFFLSRLISFSAYPHFYLTFSLFFLFSVLSSNSITSVPLPVAIIPSFTPSCRISPIFFLEKSQNYNQ